MLYSHTKATLTLAPRRRKKTSLNIQRFTATFYGISSRSQTHSGHSVTSLPRPRSQYSHRAITLARDRAWRWHWCSQPTERDRHSRRRGEAEKDKQLSSVVKCAFQQRSMVLSPLLLGCRSTGAVAYMPSWIDVRYHRPKVTCSQIRYLQCKHRLWTDKCTVVSSPP